MSGIRAPQQHHEIEKRQVYVDPRHAIVRGLENLRAREWSAISFVLLAGISWAEPGAWLLTAFISLFLWLNNFAGRRKFETLPLKLPAFLKMTDLHDNKVANRFKFRKARATVHLGNDLFSNQELWLPAEDWLTHMLFLGTTGAGKTEGLLSLAATSSFIMGGSLVYLDAKATVDVAAQLTGLARKFGREDSLRFMSYRTGNKEVLERHWDKKSSTCGVFAAGTASVVQQLLEDMMPPGGGDNQYFRDKAIAALKAFLPAVTELRDAKIINLTPNLIGQWFSLPNMIKMAYPEHHDSKLSFIRRSTGEEVVVNNKISLRRRRALQTFLKSLPVREEEAALKDPSKQGDDTYKQFSYAEGYVVKPLVEMGSSYAHIFECEQGEIDFRDIIINNHLLAIFVPATEQSKDQRAVQGKIALSGIRIALSTGLGPRTEGSVQNMIGNLPIDKGRPSVVIIDEYAEVAVEGFAVSATQGRGLGVGVIFSNQDLAGMIRASEEEAKQIWANTRLKGLGTLEDTEETWEWFRKLGSQQYVAESAGWQEGRSEFETIRKNLSASAKMVDRLNYLDLKEQVEGEVHLFQGSKIVRANIFNTRTSWKDEIGSLRMNRMLEVLPPTDEEANELMAELEPLFAIEYMNERGETPPENSGLDSSLLNFTDDSQWIYDLISAEHLKDQERQSIRDRQLAIKKSQQENQAGQESKLAALTGALAPDAERPQEARTSIEQLGSSIDLREHEWVYSFATASEAVFQSFTQIAQNAGLDEAEAQEMVKDQLSKASDEFEYTSVPIERAEIDITNCWNALAALNEKSKNS